MEARAVQIAAEKIRVTTLLQSLTNAKGTQSQRTIMIALLVWLAVKQDEIARRVTSLESVLHRPVAAQTNVIHQASR